VQYVWAILLVVFNIFALALNVLGLPGNWLMVAAAGILAWVYRHEGMFSVWTLLAVVLLAAGAEAVELLAGLIGSRRAGASRQAAWGALLGGLLGALFGTVAIPVPLLGSLLGACFGAAMGAWAMELTLRRPQRQALKSALGAGVGRLVGTVGKLAIGTLIWLVLAVAAFWP